MRVVANVVQCDFEPRTPRQESLVAIAEPVNNAPAPDMESVSISRKMKWKYCKGI